MRWAEEGSVLLLFPIVRRLLFTAAFLAIPVVAAEFGARKLVGSAVTHAVQLAPLLSMKVWRLSP